MIHRFPRDIETTEQLPDGFKPPVLGSRADVALSIRILFPDANISNLSWLIVDGPDYSIEVSTGRDDDCDGFMLHIRGDEGAVDAVMRIAQRFDARALDLTTCEFLDRMTDPGSGFRQWRAFRDRVIPK